MCNSFIVWKLHLHLMRWMSNSCKKDVVGFFVTYYSRKFISGQDMVIFPLQHTLDREQPIATLGGYNLEGFFKYPLPPPFL